MCGKKTLSTQDDVKLDRVMDYHPDAIACRLHITRLCHLHQNSQKAISWIKLVRRDYKEYIDKINHVSEECRLTLSEEQEIIAILPSYNLANDFIDHKKYLETIHNGNSTMNFLPTPIISELHQISPSNDPIKPPKEEVEYKPIPFLNFF